MVHQDGRLKRSWIGDIPGIEAGLQHGTENVELHFNSERGTRNSELARVVSLQPSATTVLAALGLLDRLVACTRYCLDVCPDVAGKIIVEDSWTAQAAQIAATKPDLVIASVPYQLEAVAEILKSGIRFLGLAPRTLADIYADIAAIAGIMGVPDRGRALIASMRESIEHVRRTVTDALLRVPQPSPKLLDGEGGGTHHTLTTPLGGEGGTKSTPGVFCEEWGKPIIASQPWVAELIDAAGGECIGTPGKQTTAEEVAAAAPDVIIAAWCGAGDRVPLEKIVIQRNWSHVPAVTNGRVYCLRDEFLNTPGPTLIHGLHALAHAIHPELFPVVPGVRRISTPVVK